MERQSIHRMLFGVAFTVDAADAGLASELEALLPSAAQAADPGGATFALDDHAELPVLDAALRRHVATEAPGHVFVHAGVVAHRGRAIVLPAPTFAGKSELVAALVEAGAAYASDEYAVLRPDGLVEPYARPLTLRGRGRVTAAQLGGTTLAEPVPVGLVAATRYEPGTSFAPAERSPAEGALLLLAHAGQARQDPDRVLDALQRALAGARVLEGPRGEAADAAAALLA
jgi:hypothetical protein